MNAKAKREPLVIANQRIRLGETRQITLPFSETYLGTSVSIPAYVLRAKRQGPRIALVATIHGDELNGLGILRQLLYDTPPELVRGTLVIIPVVNFYGMENYTRYLPDRRDLNRSFPGSPDGSISSRLAHTLFHEAVMKCDYCIDFHTAAIRRTNFPNVRGDMTNGSVRFLARAFGCELIVHGKGAEGTFRRTATAAGVPTIILEAGEIWKIEPSVVEVGVRGTMNVLKALGMVDGQPDPPIYQVASNATAWVRAEGGGILSFLARPGDLVREGQALAINSTVFAEEKRTLYAPINGIVLGMTTMPGVKPGEPVYHIAKLAKKTFARIQALVDALASNHIYRRVQEDLATSIVIRQR